MEVLLIYKKSTLQEIKQIRCLFQEISSPEAVELCDPEDRHDKDPGMLLHPAAHIFTRVNHRRLSLRRIEQKHKNLHGKERRKMSAPVRVDHEHRHKTQLA